MPGKAGVSPAAVRDNARLFSSGDIQNGKFHQAGRPFQNASGRSQHPYRGADSRGSRQMCMQACPFGSLPAETHFVQTVLHPDAGMPNHLGEFLHFGYKPGENCHALSLTAAGETLAFPGTDRLQHLTRYLFLSPDQSHRHRYHCCYSKVSFPQDENMARAIFFSPVNGEPEEAPAWIFLTVVRS